MVMISTSTAAPAPASPSLLAPAGDMGGESNDDTGDAGDGDALNTCDGVGGSVDADNKEEELEAALARSPPPTPLP
jgi:hypothetical protein